MGNTRQRPGKINLKFWIASLCCLPAFVFPLLAQLPSETFDWLKANLGGAACVVFQIGTSRADLKQVTENTEVRFLDCNMTLETATTIGSKSELRTFHVPLGELNPRAISLIEGFKIPTGWIAAGDVPSYTMRLAAPGGTGREEDGFEATLEQFGVNATPPSGYHAAEISILLRHKDTAERLVTELSRAVEFCHGK